MVTSKRPASQRPSAGIQPGTSSMIRTPGRTGRGGWHNRLGSRGRRQCYKHGQTEQKDGLLRRVSDTRHLRRDSASDKVVHDALIDRAIDLRKIEHSKEWGTER